MHIDLITVMTAFPALERLDLSQNKIETLLTDTSTTFTNGTLRRLLLSRNHLTDLTQLANLSFTGLEVLTLFGNYIDIDSQES